MTASRDGTVKLWEFEDLDLGLGEALRVDCSLTLEAEGQLGARGPWGPWGHVAVAHTNVPEWHLGKWSQRLKLA